MESDSIVGLFIVIFTAMTTYQGLTKSSYQNKYLFSVDDILVHKDYKRMLTSGFLHGGWLHFGFNMIALMSFAYAIESLLGMLELALIYFASLLGGSLLSLIIHRNHGEYTAVGASGAVSGVVAATILLSPLGKVGFILIPIEITSWIFGLLYILISILGIKSQSDNIGHEAHLGGTLTGLVLATILAPSMAIDNWQYALILILPILAFFILIWQRPNILVTGKWNFSLPKRRQQSISNNDVPRTYPKDQLANSQHSAQEIDRILEKIKRKGIESLSKRERKILDEFGD